MIAGLRLADLNMVTAWGGPLKEVYSWRQQDMSRREMYGKTRNPNDLAPEGPRTVWEVLNPRFRVSDFEFKEFNRTDAFA
jgi:hypothetical protein